MPNARPSPFPATADDYRRLARRRLPRFLFDYVDGGAGREQTLAANAAGFDALKLRQRVLVDVGDIDTSTALLGQPADLPLMLAPAGLAGMLARRGEVQAARAADSRHLPMTVSTVGICPFAEVQAASRQPVWFQLYMLRDREAVGDILDQVWADGCRTLVFTIDLPLPGMRHRDTRNGLGVPGLRAGLVRARQVLARPRWLHDVALRGKPLTFGNLTRQVPDARNLDAFKAWVDSQFDPTVTWDDMDWLRKQWRGRLLLKGVMEADDARRAADSGADGLIVSNHGGRQLDPVAASIRKLPAIVDAVGDQLDVFVDGGIQGGADIFKALALGARGALVGRAWLWALAAGGQRGVESLVDALQRELALTMTLCGVTRIADINHHHLDGGPL